MVVMLADQQLHDLAAGLNCSGEFAILALEFGSLAGAVGDDQRRVQPIDMSYWAQCGYSGVIERDVAAACR